MTDEEKDFYEKYIKPQYTIAKRIKMKIFGSRKRIKTIKDFEGIEGDFLNIVKIMLAIMLIYLTGMVIMQILEIYRWFFPLKETIPQSPFFRYVSTSNWILLANTTQSTVDYARLVIIMFGLLVAIAGLRQMIRGSRKKETIANEN